MNLEIPKSRSYDEALSIAPGNLGLRREAQRHAAFRPGEKSTEARQSFARAKAVSPLPLCHRIPKRGSNLEPA